MPHEVKVGCRSYVGFGAAILAAVIVSGTAVLQQTRPSKPVGDVGHINEEEAAKAFREPGFSPYARRHNEQGEKEIT
jgi:hypothetical protein